MSTSAKMEDRSAASSGNFATPIVFAGNRLDRVGNLRRDSAWIEQAIRDKSSLFLPFLQFNTLIVPGAVPRLDWRPSTELQAIVKSDAVPVLLGRDGDICRFAINSTAYDNGQCDGWGEFADVRSVAPLVSPEEAGILAQARSLLEWHARHAFCAVCGAQTQPREGGYTRRCINETCQAQHFPRTDPVVIMLVIRGEDCLLGRQERFPKGIYSCLAGFMEPGETIEDAVRREVWEEAGVKVGKVHYHASQPWPFPASLMIGCFGEAQDEQISVDHHEIDDARWFGKAEVARMIARSTTDEVPRMPPSMAIAHQLAKAWVEGAGI